MAIVRAEDPQITKSRSWSPRESTLGWTSFPAVESAGLRPLLGYKCENIATFFSGGGFAVIATVDVSVGRRGSVLLGIATLPARLWCVLPALLPLSSFLFVDNRRCRSGFVARGCVCVDGGAPAARLAAFSAFFCALSWAPVSFVSGVIEGAMGGCASGFLVGFGWVFVGVGGGAPFTILGEGGGMVKVGAVGSRGEFVEGSFGSAMLSS